MKKRTKWKRVLAAVLSLTLLTGVLGACGAIKESVPSCT